MLGYGYLKRDATTCLVVCPGLQKAESVTVLDADLTHPGTVVFEFTQVDFTFVDYFYLFAFENNIQEIRSIPLEEFYMTYQTPQSYSNVGYGHDPASVSYDT